MSRFNIMLEDFGFKDINPLICGWETCDPGHSFGPVARSYLLLHYVRSGKGIFETNGHHYPVSKGEIFVIHPGEITTYTADTTNPWEYSWIGFHASIPLPACLAQPVVKADGCEHIFRTLLHRREGERGNELYLCAKIYELLALLDHQAEPVPKHAQRYVNKAKNYMNSSYMEQITIEQIAKQLGLDRSYFCRIFKETEGVAPVNYLVNLRLERAAELIADRGYSPAEAASSCGYTDTVNFSRMFKKHFGVPPSRYGKTGEPLMLP